MGIVNILEIIVIGFQFLALTSTYDIEWPMEFQTLTRILVYLVQIPIFPDIRMQHIVISYLCPIFLSLIVLLCFRSIFSILKDLLGLFGWMGLAIGIYSYFKNIHYAMELIYVCSAIIVVFLLEAGVKALSKYKNQKNKIPSKSSIDEEPLPEPHHKAKWKQVRNFILSIVCIAISILYITVYQVDKLYFIAIGTIGLMLLYNFGSNLFLKGRLFNTKINYYFRKHVIQVILFFLAFLYVPITLNALRFMIPSKYLLYRDKHCLDTQLLKMKMPFAPFYYGSDLCLNTTNAYKVDMTMDYDLSFNLLEESFYEMDTTIPYSTEVLPYFLPGSILAFLLITIAMPYLFFKLVNVCFNNVNALTLRTDLIVPEDLTVWEIRSSVSNNCCKSMYSDLKETFKDLKLILLAYRLLIVGVYSFTFVPHAVNNSYIFIIIGFVHFVGCILSSIYKPFAHYSENFLFSALQALNFLLALFGGCVAFGISISSSVSLGMIILVLVLPLFAFAIGFWLDIRRVHQLKEDINYRSYDAFVEFTSEQMRDSDMRLDKKLQFPIVGYFTLLLMLLIISAFLSIYGYNKHFFTFIIANGRLDGSMESILAPMTAMNQQGFTGPFRSCSDVNTLIANCACVDMHFSVVNQTEVWKCEKTAYSNELVVLERKLVTLDSVQAYDDLVLSIRPYCSRSFDMTYLSANFTLISSQIPNDIGYTDFFNYWSQYC